MQILIETTKLELLLEKKRSYIGRRVVWDSVASAISFVISVLLGDFKSFLGIPGIALKTFFLILGSSFSVKAITDLIRAVRNRYDYKNLQEDIVKLNEITHNHSIVIIRDSFNEFPNRFLVYDDLRWNCPLFLNYKENTDNEAFIMEHLSRELKVPADAINLRYVSQRIHEKFSVSAQENRLYSHKFYLAELKEFSPEIQKDEFELDGRNYRWCTIQELEQNADVREKNLDIVNFVKELY